ncbi:DUF397 domain-containing protein [Streptomyces sp. NBC_01235]|nr:DUF397 domain-containing protein [Streptomyces sp. NBC_01235]
MEGVGDDVQHEPPVHVRDSKLTDGPAFRVAAAAWAGFVM